MLALTLTPNNDADNDGYDAHNAKDDDVNGDADEDVYVDVAVDVGVAC